MASPNDILGIAFQLLFLSMKEVLSLKSTRKMKNVDVIKSSGKHNTVFKSMKRFHRKNDGRMNVMLLTSHSLNHLRF